MNGNMQQEIAMAGVQRTRKSLFGELTSDAGHGLKPTQTADSSGAWIDDEATYEITQRKGLNSLTGLIQYFPDTAQFLRKVEVNDKSAPKIEGYGTIAPKKNARANHLNMIQQMAEKRSYRVLSALKTELSASFSASGISLERAFRAFDTDRSGSVDRVELKNALRSLGAQITEQQMDDMFSMLDKDGDGEVDYAEFARWFGAGPPPPPMLPQVKEQAARQAAAPSRDGFLNEIAQAGTKRATVSLMDQINGYKGGVVLNEVETVDKSAPMTASPETSLFASINGFAGCDFELKSVQTVDKSAPVLESNVSIKQGENAQSMLSGLVPYFPETAKFLKPVQTVDKSVPNFEGYGSVTAPQKNTRAMHLNMIQEAAEKRSRRVLQQLKLELGSMFSASGVSLERAFRAFDEDSSGSVDKSELSEGLKSLGLEVPDNTLNDIFAMLDKDGGGDIDYLEFARWFGAGPPPAPITPQQKSLVAAQAAVTTDNTDHLAAIRGAASGRQAQSAASSYQEWVQAQSSAAAVIQARYRGSSARKQAATAAPAAASSAVAPVVGAMLAHKFNGGVQQAGVHALWSMAYQNPANRTMIARDGGVEAILSAIGNHAGNDDLVASACSALASLAVDDAVAEKIRAMDGVDVATTAMMLHMASAKIQEAAMALLTNLN